MKSIFEVSALRLTLVMLSVSLVYLFSPEIVQGAISVGDIGDNVADASKGVARGAVMFAYVVGLIMVGLGIKDLFDAGQQQGNATYGKGFIKIVVGGLALAISAVIGSGSITIFGTDQTEGLDRLGI